MKRKLYKILPFVFGVLFLAVSGFINPKVADSKIVTNVPSDISGEELKAIVVEDFEKSKADAWLLTSSPRKYTKTNSKKKDPVPELNVKVVEGFPNDMSVEKWSLTGLGKEKKMCLGVHFKFRYPGYNSVSVLPPLEVSWDEKKPVKTYSPVLRKEVQERGIQLPGKAKAISLWVHARGNPYDLEVWVKDYKGDTHILKMGSINFVGWRPMKVYLPSNIPQALQSYPQTKIAKIVRFVIRAKPSAIPSDVYVFFDQIKVLTDTYEVTFDGQKLHKAFEKKSKSSNGK